MALGREPRPEPRPEPRALPRASPRGLRAAWQKARSETRQKWRSCRASNAADAGELADQRPIRADRDRHRTGIDEPRPDLAAHGQRPLRVGGADARRAGVDPTRAAGLGVLDADQARRRQLVLEWARDRQADDGVA